MNALLDSSERLKPLRAQYASVSAYLEPDHPDLIKLKQEMSSLEKRSRRDGWAGGTVEAAYRGAGGARGVAGTGGGDASLM